MNGKNIGKLKKKTFVIEAAATLLFISLTSGNVLGNDDIFNKNRIQNTDTNDSFATDENIVQISDMGVNDDLLTINNFVNEASQSTEIKKIDTKF